MTVRAEPSKAIRLTSREALRPPTMSRMPASRSSSFNRPIAYIISVVHGGGAEPFSLSDLAFTNTIGCIFRLIA